jgi:hypothetical protein
MISLELVFNADHVTVSKCEVSNFIVGLLVETAIAPWSDLTVRESTFNNNVEFGMYLQGGILPINRGTVTVVDSVFNENGNSDFGAGVATINVEGTFYSSTMNDNIGFRNAGFFSFVPGERTLIDVNAKGNLVGSGAGPILPFSQCHQFNCLHEWFGRLDMAFVDTARAKYM